MLCHKCSALCRAGVCFCTACGAALVYPAKGMRAHNEAAEDRSSPAPTERAPVMPALAAMKIAVAGKKGLGLLPALANRHGLITGSTGTGKTVTLQRMAEQFSAAGVPVFMADVKGDLSGLGAPGLRSEKIEARLEQLGVSEWQSRANPVIFWDVFGADGHPVRATIASMGPTLLSRLLELNQTQEGVLQVLFKIAEDEEVELNTLQDLRELVGRVGQNAKGYTIKYGNVAPASIGTIQRSLLVLDRAGGANFFGEPMLDIVDLMQATTDHGGGLRGFINILAAEKLMNSPRLYSTFLLWLLTELFIRMPEAGDLAKPRLVFFFDEAHLLFHEARPAVLEKVEQVVRLIRSKGVGVYFVTQSPSDVPDEVLAQLSNRVQHALRAFTPHAQRAVRAAAATLRQNLSFDAETAIMEMGVGEALISFLDEKGSPNIVERGFIIPPGSRIGPLSEDERREAICASSLYGRYEIQNKDKSAE